jgi:hypothetical protein
VTRTPDPQFRKLLDVAEFHQLWDFPRPPKDADFRHRSLASPKGIAGEPMFDEACLTPLPNYTHRSGGLESAKTLHRLYSRTISPSRKIWSAIASAASRSPPARRSDCFRLPRSVASRLLSLKGPQSKGPLWVRVYLDGMAPARPHETCGSTPKPEHLSGRNNALEVDLRSRRPTLALTPLRSAFTKAEMKLRSAPGAIPPRSNSPRSKALSVSQYLRWRRDRFSGSDGSDCPGPPFDDPFQREENVLCKITSRDDR